jgi:hypothetical protein
MADKIHELNTILSILVENVIALSRVSRYIKLMNNLCVKISEQCLDSELNEIIIY